MSKDSKLPSPLTAFTASRAGSCGGDSHNASHNASRRTSSAAAGRNDAQSGGHVASCSSRTAVHFTTVGLLLVMAMWLVA